MGYIIIEALIWYATGTLYGAKIVDITYDDRPKLIYYTITLGRQNTVENGQKLVENGRK